MPRAVPCAAIPACPTLEWEQELWRTGYTCVVGVDEAGRGALAGPVTAGAVILPRDPAVAQALCGVRDSKQLSPPERERQAGHIRAAALAWGVGHAQPGEIDTLRIAAAVRLAATRAIAGLTLPPQAALVDFIDLRPEIALHQVALVKGDCRALSIAAASVLAKTARDALMIELDAAFPGYGFAQHKGYGSRQHRERIQALGLTPIHRRSFTLHAGPATVENPA